MKKLLFVITAVTFLYSCANDKKQEKEIVDAKSEIKIDSTLITDTSWGVIRTNNNFENLQQLFGDANVVDERICGPECVDSIDVTKIYKGTSKEITIYWDTEDYHKLINLIESVQENAPYHTAAGIKIGSTLKDLLIENGQPINFLGFGWDYGGAVTNLNHGKLDDTYIKFRVDLKGESADNDLMGDIELNTAMPAVKKNIDNIVVSRLFLYFKD